MSPSEICKPPGTDIQLYIYPVSNTSQICTKDKLYFIFKPGICTLSSGQFILILMNMHLIYDPITTEDFKPSLIV